MIKFLNLQNLILLTNYMNIIFYEQTELRLNGLDEAKQMLMCKSLNQFCNNISYHKNGEARYIQSYK